MGIVEEIDRININSYKATYPFPYTYLDDILEYNFAKNIQDEVLSLEDDCWDRYENPFEKKYTLRNKDNLPVNVQELFQTLSSKIFIEKLSKIVGVELYKDDIKNWWGIHKYN